MPNLQGYQRTLVLEGSLRSFLSGIHAQPDLRYIDREAVALLLGEAGSSAGNSGSGGSWGQQPLPRALVVDVRRSDERALYGAIKGSVHIPRAWARAVAAMCACCVPPALRRLTPKPVEWLCSCCSAVPACRHHPNMRCMLVPGQLRPAVASKGLTSGPAAAAVDQLPSALMLPAEQFTAVYNFRKPTSDDLLIMSSKCAGAAAVWIFTQEWRNWLAACLSH